MTVPQEHDAHDAHDTDDAEPGRPTRVARRVGRGALKGLKWIGILLGVLVGFWIVVIAVLLITNPEPSDRIGWERHADSPVARGEVAGTVVDGTLLMAGGFRGVWGTTDAVDAYSVAKDVWIDLPDLPEARHHAAAASVDDRAYVTGGGSSVLDWEPHDDAWVLIPDADRWQRIDALPEGRLGHDMVSFDGKLYVIGGDGHTTRVLIYDPETGWSTGAAQPGEERDHLKAVVVENEIWALGGRIDDDPQPTVDVYDPMADEWTEGPELPEGMSAMAVGVLEGRVHVVGGEDPALLTGNAVKRHFSIAPDEAEWERESDAMVQFHAAASGVIDGRLYIAGGSRRQGPLSPLAYTGLTQSFGP